MEYKYSEVLKSINDMCDYIKDKNSLLNFEEIIKPIDFYLDNEQKFPEEQKQMIEKGLARMAVTHTITQMKSKNHRIFI
jgi:hypothetical protein